jgi:formate hydrogenlyase subunit 3/multisubunit Na+/H+ antiporter MnhD subunit
MSTLILVMFGAFGAGVLLSAVWPSPGGARIAALSCACLGGATAVTLGGLLLIRGVSWSAHLPSLLAPLGGVTLHVDPLGGLFLALIGGTAIPAALYAMGAFPHAAAGRGRIMHALLNLCLAAMCLVATSGNAGTFLFGWELMALASYLLVVASVSDDDTAHAGLWYAGIAHAGFLALLGAFVLLANGGSFEFDAIRTRHALSAGTTTMIFVLTLVGFGSKAGLVPLHIGLVRGDSAAPPHAASLMSGAMTKLAIYGFVRVFFDLLPPGPAWWGGVMLAAGVLTAITGVLYSVAETHIQRLLAYSTIENVGIMVVGLGFALLMRGYGYPSLAAIGLIACLLHAINHAAFKSLLFLGAGAVVHSTRSTSLEAYGGLIKRMPYTALLCFIGVLSLAALPPLNGFPSEWLTFQVLVAGASHTASELAIVLPLALAGVALTAGLAAVSAVRLFGITFLALPRTAAAASAEEVPGVMRAAMILPAAVCVMLGLAPTVVIPRLGSIAATLGIPAGAMHAGSSITMPFVGSHLWPAGTAALLLMAAVAFAAIARRRTQGRRVIASAWSCGRYQLSPRKEYTAAAYAEPLRRVFTGFYRPTQQVTIDVHPASRYFVKSIAVRGGLAPWIEQATFGPLLRATRWASLRAKRLHRGSINGYLALLPLALLALLILAHWIQP